MPRSLFTLLFILCFCTCGRAQNSEGRDFWFTFLEHRDPGNTKVALISARRGTSGTISVPGSNWSQNFTVGENNVAQITLPLGSETKGSEGVTGTAVHVEANGIISLYIHQYFRNRSEASLVLPTPALGTEYYVMAYSGRPDAQVNYPSSFAIVATEDATMVSISELAAPTEGGRSADQNISVVLNEGQVYQVRASNGNDDLTGTRISSSAPVAVFAGASWSGVPAQTCGLYDNLLEVNYPISQWGTRYVGIPTLRNSGNLYRVLASEDGTVVNVTGTSTFTRLLNAGEFTDFQESGAINVRSNKPVLVAEFLLGSQCNGHPNGGTGDPSFFLLNEVSQTQDTVTVYNSNLQDIFENYLNILFRTGDEVGILLDGAPITDPLEAVPGGEYSFYRVRVNTGNHTITSGGCGVIVTVYGYGDVESYSYSGGAAFRNINSNPIVEGGCLNDTITFSTGLDTLRFRHTWTLEDGTTETRANFTRFYDQLGEYPIRLILEDECLGQIDTSFRDLQITQRQALDVSPEARECEGAELLLEAFGLPEDTYRWISPNGVVEEARTLFIPALDREDAGIYTAIGNISGCETFPADVMVTVDTSPVVTITGNTVFCARRDDPPQLNAGIYADYEWSGGSGRNPLTAIDGGIYTVTVTDEFGCIGVDSILVNEFCPTRFYVSSAFSPNADGINDRFGIFAVDFTSTLLEVFDRWGGLMFASTPEVPEWDGWVNGEAAAAGSYLYKATVEGIGDDGAARTQVQSGVVVLVR
ncbi:T9SS type B sorting domain-containing protein [Neolewinella persica]|uniref:T9SS type B sorting domain-containing protein n=1 Tax=Neolewinella persica TaxID=70998 RepID=UPI000379AD5E|nr:gliding motility-associated C-terminal domain-containing protein [Neolewinella persica]